MDEEFPQFIPLFSRMFDVVNQIEGEVLLHCTVRVLVLNDFLFSLDIAKCSSDFKVVDASILW